MDMLDAVEHNKYSTETLQSCHKITDFQNALIEIEIRKEEAQSIKYLFYSCEIVNLSL